MLKEQKQLKQCLKSRGPFYGNSEFRLMAKSHELECKSYFLSTLHLLLYTQVIIKFTLFGTNFLNLVDNNLKYVRNVCCKNHTSLYPNNHSF